MANEVLKSSGGVDLIVQNGRSVRNYGVVIDGRWVYGSTVLDNARAVANAAHKARRGSTADKAAAALIRSAEISRDQMPGMSEAEAIYGSVNVSLGMCPDGCCGGPEMFDSPDDPRYVEWKAWRGELWDAVRKLQPV
ncbi:MAG: hypothetical protein ACOYOQ_00360 [Microthrixaceae bacterium]